MTTPPDDRTGEGNRILTRRSAIVGGVCAACAGAAGYLLGDNNGVRRTETRESAMTTNNASRNRAQPDGVFRVRTREKVVAMTFDDGPDARYTQHVLDLLTSVDASATFFQIGVNAQAEPALTNAVLHAGHTIGNHTFDHANLELLHSAGIESEIDRGEEALVSVGVPRPNLFRPPKGYTDEAVGILADAARYKTVFWGLCVEAFVNHQDIGLGVNTMLDRVRPGEIILAHDGGHVVGVPDRPVLSRERTMESLPLLFSGLAKRGYRVVDVPTLLTFGR